MPDGRDVVKSGPVLTGPDLTTSRFRGLLVDYGGVLTNPLHHTMDDFCRDLDLDAAELEQTIRALYGSPDGPGIVHGLETGAVEVEEFEVALAQRLRTRAGGAVDPAGLLTRMFSGFRRDDDMLDAVRRARAAGVRTGLLSNSWGVDGYPRQDWAELFDTVVISGEVGLRKPAPEIYRLAADRLGLAVEDCVFVDDLEHNVKGAVAAGMHAIRHTDAKQTISELEALLAVRLH